MIQTLRAIEPTNSNTYYKLNARCAYHSNIPGNYINNWWALRNNIQDLIDNREIKFNSPETPTVITTLMPSHDKTDWRLDGQTFGSLDLLSFASPLSVCLNI